MRIKVGHAYMPGKVAIGEAVGDSDITWTGELAAEAAETEEHYREGTGLRGEALLQHMLQAMRGRSHWALPDYDGPLTPEQYVHLRSGGRTLTADEVKAYLADYGKNYGPDGMFRGQVP